MTEFYKNYSLATKAMDEMTKLYKCNLVNECKHQNCVHAISHRPYPLGNKNGYPQCQDKSTYCYWKEQLVNCIEVKENQ